MRAAAATVLMLALAAPAARAQERRAVLLEPLDGEVAVRIEGQTADLPWTLERAEAPAPGSPAIDRARAAARLHDVRVVVWLEPTDRGGWTVFVAEAEEGRLLARAIDPPPGEPLSSSAVAEAAAMVVRGALRDLAAGGHVGIVVAEPEPEPVREAPPDPAPPDHRGGPRLGALVGWQLALDGHSPIGQQGPTAGLVLDAERWSVALAFAAAIPAELEDERSTVRLTRYAIWVAVGHALVDAPSLDLAVAVTAGAVLLDRTTVTHEAGLAPTPARRTPHPLVGGEARLRWWPDLGGGTVGLAVAAGADVLPVRPVLGYREGDQVVVRNRLWPVQPRISLQIAVRTP